MANRWIFCRRCNPTMIAGVGAGGLGSFSGPSGVPDMPNECPGCNILFVAFTFINEEVADLVVGSGNHIGGVTDLWVLFYDSGDYTRDASRPLACTVGTITHPDDATLDLIVSITVNGFVWERASTVSTDPDFDTFNLTTGVIDTDVCNCGPCVGVYIEKHRTPFAWENPPEDFVAAVSLPSSGDPCAFDPPCEQDFTTPVCLSYDPDYVASLLGVVDGWGFGGRWRWGDWYLGTGDAQCPEAATLTIAGEINDDCEDQENGQFTAANLCCELRLAWEDCDRDPRIPPDETLFTVILSDPCSGSLDSLTYGGTCEEDGGRINCPPDDCPGAYVEWTWNTDTLIWEVTDSNCELTGTAIGPAPDDPLITDVTWVECNCCVEVTPECEPGWSPCPGDECGWVWDATGVIWNAQECPSFGCFCHDPPERAGLFDGETIPGICCSEDP
jgi:hypothetical protein